jgi:signal peptidase I
MRNIKSNGISRIKSFARNNYSFLLIIVGLTFFRTALADWSPVPSSSMEPTIYPGDVLLINKTALGPNIPFTEGRLWQTGQPARGDIVTLTPPGKDITYVKRVVGLPGDRIRMQGLQLFINEQAVPLTLTDDGSSTGVLKATELLGEHEHQIQADLRYPLREIPETLVVPAEHYFVMGDFRNNSEDSRYFGVVHQDRVIGRVARLAVSVAGERDWLSTPLQQLQ